MKALVARQFSFDAAHFLPNYNGKCRNMHGHRWTIEVGIEGDVGLDGMVVDFGDLKSMVQPILDNFDHGLINTIVENPTAENIASYVWNWIVNVRASSYNSERINLLEPTLKHVRVWETPDSYAEVRE